MGGLERVNLSQSDELALHLTLPDAKLFAFLRTGIEGQITDIGSSLCYKCVF
jgi:hypothetical protein